MAGYIGARSGTISATVANVQDVTATDTTPEVTIINNTHEDTDGGREGKVIFKGQQSGGEESTLAEIRGSHDGTSDDEKGDLIFKTNDGSDGASPTERLRIDSNGSIVPSTLGTSNVKFGLNAGNNIASGGNYNTVIGEEAGNDITTGDNNTLIGTFSGDAITTSGGNTAVGSYTMTSMTDGSDNVAVGTSALDVDTKGNNSVAIGRNALGAQNFTSATNAYNVAVGHSAGVSNTTGTYNTFIGPQAGFNITTGSKNTVVGQFDGNAHSLDIRTSSNNIVLSDGDGNNRLHHNGSYLFAGNLTAASYWPSVGTSSGQNAFSVHATNGAVGVTSNDVPLYLNKNNGDGILLYLYSEGSAEGSISVSGSTVSYQGGHLSRWSQLSDGSKDSSLVKGTVMTNLDKMCVWEVAAVAEGDTIKSASGDERIATADDVADAYTENNEQLNCMAVSSVEGDPNVAGVFVNWDFTDDGYNDLNVAMTGDMVIRIAKGTTVARGDLLMSAGDGTAKPQGDDIVRSKTIAKVTSTNVSHTYDDESYLVPCVLMAC